MVSRSWKRSESAIAALLGGKRNPINGRGCQADVESDWLAIEVKSRASIPAWLKKSLAQARAGAKRDQLPVSILHEEGTRHLDDLVVMTMRDFLEWHGPVAGPGDMERPPDGEEGHV